MGKRVFSLLVIGLSAMALGKTLGCKGGKGESLKVGIITSLTGPQAKFGEQQKYGYDLAIDEINAKGGVLGRPIELVYKDDMGKSEEAMTAAEDLINRERVLAVMGSYTSGATLPMTGVMERGKTPLLCPCAAKDEITQQGYTWIFRLNAPSSEYAKSMFDFLTEVIKPKSVAICFENTSFGASTARAARRLVDEYDLELTAYEPYEAKVTDFTPMLTKVKATTPDVLFAVSYLADAILIMRQSHQLDFNTVAAGGAAGYTLPAFIEGAGEDAEYVFSATQWTKDVSWPGAKEFYSKFIERFKVEPDYHAAETYAATWVLADALKRAGSLDRRKVRDALAETNMNTIFGPVSFEDYGGYKNQNRHPMLVLQIRKGEFCTVWPREFATKEPIHPIPKWDERTSKSQ